MALVQPLRRGGAAIAWPLGHRITSAALLFLVCLALFLPGFMALPPMDRDEPRFAQATKQMLETGDFVDIRYQDSARNAKPVGVYWMQAAAVSMAERLGVPDARSRIWVYRLPALGGAIAAVLLTYWAALALGSSRAAFLAALLFAATVLIGVEARLAKTDAIITATVAACMGVLARVYAARDGAARQPGDFGRAALFWTAIAVGILVKGPITPMIPAFAAIVLSFKERSARWLLRLRPGLGLLWCLVLAAPWFVLIMIDTHGRFLTDSVGGDMLAKVAGARESHGAPPGSYLLAFFLTGWPMAPLTALAAAGIWRHRAQPAQAFLLAWVVPGWLLFEAVPTKLPHYVLPLYPGIAIATALAISEGQVVLRGVGAWVLRAIPTILLIVLGALLAASVRLGAPGPAFFIALPFMLWVCWRLFRLPGRGGVEQAVAHAAALSFLLGIAAYDGLLSADFFAPFRLSPRLIAVAEAARAADPACPRLDLASAGYAEPSLVLLGGTDLLLTSGAGAAQFLAGGTCRLAFIEQRDMPGFRAAIGNTSLRTLPPVEGFDVNGGRRMDFTILMR